MEPGFKRDIVQGARSYFSTCPIWNCITGRDPAPLRDWCPVMLERLLTVIELDLPLPSAHEALSDGLDRDLAFGRLSWVGFFLRVCRYQPLSLEERATLEMVLARATELLPVEHHGRLTCQILEQPTPEEIEAGAGPSFTAPQQLAWLSTFWPMEGDLPS